MRSGVAALPQAHARSRDFVALAKPRLNLLVVASAVAGYVMGAGDMADVARVASIAVGTALVAGGASAFKQVIERRTDALMRRTRLRPMADNRMSAGEQPRSYTAEHHKAFLLRRRAGS